MSINKSKEKASDIGFSRTIAITTHVQASKKAKSESPEKNV